VRSVNARLVALAVCPLLTVGAAACATTQQKAAWLALRNDRNADRKPIVVHRVDRQVKVVRASLVRGSGGAAVAVTLRNAGPDPVNDLPILVGVRSAAGGSEPLNSDGHVPYFQAHAPAIAPGQETTWVFTTKDTLATAGAPYARVGNPSPSPLTTASRVPALGVRTSSHSADKGTVRATVSNTTGLPQYDVAVYAWADKGGHLVAAGRGQIADLNAGDSSTVNVTLIGDPKDAKVHVAAPPTIFQ
jgi:hypothetical protein